MKEPSWVREFFTLMKLVILETLDYIKVMGKAITSPKSERAARHNKERNGGYAKGAVKIKSFRTYTEESTTATQPKVRRRAASVLTNNKRKK